MLGQIIYICTHYFCTTFLLHVFNYKIHLGYLLRGTAPPVTKSANHESKLSTYFNPRLPVGVVTPLRFIFQPAKKVNSTIK